MKLYHNSNISVETGQPDPRPHLSNQCDYSTINYVCKEANNHMNEHRQNLIENSTFICPHGRIIDINKRTSNINGFKLPNLKKINYNKSHSCLISWIKYFQQQCNQIKKKQDTQIMFIHEDVAAAMKQLKCDVERFSQFERTNCMFKIAKINGESAKTILARMSIKIYEIEERLMRNDIPTCAEILVRRENMLNLIRSLQQSIGCYLDAEVEALKDRQSKLCNLLRYLLNIEKEFHCITRNVKQQCCNNYVNDTIPLLNASFFVKTFDEENTITNYLPTNETRKNSINETVIKNDATCTKKSNCIIDESDKKNDKDMIRNNRFDETKSTSIIDEPLIKIIKVSKSSNQIDELSKNDAAILKRSNLIDAKKYNSIDGLNAKIATDLQKSNLTDESGIKITSSLKNAKSKDFNKSNCKIRTCSKRLFGKKSNDSLVSKSSAKNATDLQRSNLIEESKDVSGSEITSRLKRSDFMPKLKAQMPKSYTKFRTCSNRSNLSFKESNYISVDKPSGKIESGLKKVVIIDEPKNIPCSESDIEIRSDSKRNFQKDKQSFNDERSYSPMNNFFVRNKSTPTDLNINSGYKIKCNFECNLGLSDTNNRLNPNAVRSDQTLNSSRLEVIDKEGSYQIPCPEAGDSLCEMKHLNSDDSSYIVCESEEVLKSMGDMSNIWYESARRLLLQ